MRPEDRRWTSPKESERRQAIQDAASVLMERFGARNSWSLGKGSSEIRLNDDNEQAAHNPDSQTDDNSQMQDEPSSCSMSDEDGKIARQLWRLLGEFVEREKDEDLLALAVRALGGACWVLLLLPSRESTHADVAACLSDSKIGGLLFSQDAPALTTAALGAILDVLSALAMAPSSESDQQTHIEITWGLIKEGVRRALRSHRRGVRALALKCILAGGVYAHAEMVEGAYLSEDAHAEVRKLACTCLSHGMRHTMSKLQSTGASAEDQRLAASVCASAWGRTCMLLHDNEQEVGHAAHLLLTQCQHEYQHVGRWRVMRRIMASLPLQSNVSSTDMPWDATALFDVQISDSDANIEEERWSKCLDSVSLTAKVNSLGALVCYPQADADPFMTEEANSSYSTIIDAHQACVLGSHLLEVCASYQDVLPTCRRVCGDMGRAVGAENLLSEYSYLIRTEQDSAPMLQALAQCLECAEGGGRIWGHIARDGAIAAERLTCAAAAKCNQDIQEEEDRVCAHMQVLAHMRWDYTMHTEMAGVIASLAVIRVRTAWRGRERVQMIVDGLLASIIQARDEGSLNEFVDKRADTIVKTSLRRRDDDQSGEEACAVRDEGLVWVSLKFGREALDSVAQLLIIAAVRMLDHYQASRKLHGAMLAAHLTQHLDRTTLRWNKDILMPQLWNCLHCEDADVIAHAVPCFSRAVIALHAADAQETHDALAYLLTQGIYEARAACRSVYAVQVEALWVHMGAYACGEVIRAIELCDNIAKAGGEHEVIMCMRILSLIAATCWPRASAHMAGILQVAFHAYLTHSGKPYATRVTPHLTNLCKAHVGPAVLCECDQQEFVRLASPALEQVSTLRLVVAPLIAHASNLANGDT